MHIFVCLASFISMAEVMDGDRQSELLKSTADLALFHQLSNAYRINVISTTNWTDLNSLLQLTMRTHILY